MSDVLWWARTIRQVYADACLAEAQANPATASNAAMHNVALEAVERHVLLCEHRSLEATLRACVRTQKQYEDALRSIATIGEVDSLEDAVRTANAALSWREGGSA